MALRWEQRKSLLADKNGTPLYQPKKLYNLTHRIAELTEELEELKSEKAILLNSLDCAEDADISTVRKEIATLESGLKKLEEQAADMDSVELMDARLNIRNEQERSAIDRVKAAYGEKYDFSMMAGCKQDVASLLHEEIEIRSVREQLLQKRQQAQQKKTQRKHRDSRER